MKKSKPARSSCFSTTPPVPAKPDIIRKNYRALPIIPETPQNADEIRTQEVSADCEPIIKRVNSADKNTTELKSYKCKDCKHSFKLETNRDQHHCWALARHCRICDDIFHAHKGHRCRRKW